MNLRPLVVTGPIGSGKSTVSKLLEGFGAHRVDLDRLSREVLETEDGRGFVATRWPGVMTASGVDRGALAEIVFKDESELARLERFIHPLVLTEYKTKYESKSPLVVEVSVPFSIAIDNSFVLLVDVADELRFARLLDRGMDPEDILSRMAAQKPRSEWLQLADAVIPNRGSEAALRGNVESFWAWWTQGRL